MKRFAIALAVVAAIVCGAVLLYNAKRESLRSPSESQPPAKPSVTLAEVVDVKSRAETAWERVKGTGRGLGFDKLLDEADTQYRTAEAFYDKNAYAEARDGFQKLADQCAALQALKSKRRAAWRASGSANTARNKAEQAKAQVHAKDLFSAAQQLDREAEQTFGSGEFAKAAGLWLRAVLQYGQAQRDAKASARRPPLRPMYKCKQCGHEFEPAEDKRPKDMMMMGPGMMPFRADCPKCGKKKCSVRMARCPHCEKYYISPRMDFDERMMQGEIEQGEEPPADICAHCKTDRIQWYRDNRKRKKR